MEGVSDHLIYKSFFLIATACFTQNTGKMPLPHRPRTTSQSNMRIGFQPSPQSSKAAEHSHDAYVTFIDFHLRFGQDVVQY
jgi:hypothetical protein